MSVPFGRVITIESYDEGVVVKTGYAYEIPVLTTKEKILRDMIEALAVITNGETTRLELIVSVNKHGQYLLKKKWLT